MFASRAFDSSERVVGFYDYKQGAGTCALAGLGSSFPIGCLTL